MRRTITDRKPPVVTEADTFKELLLDNGFVSSKPMNGQLTVAFHMEGRGSFFLPVIPKLKDSLINAGFLATIVQAILGPTGYFYPVHGKIQIIGPVNHNGASGDTRYQAVENLLLWRAEKLNPKPSTDAGIANSSGPTHQDHTGGVQDVDNCIVPGSTWTNLESTD